MSTRQVMTAWLLFGLGMGVLAGTNIMLATNGAFIGGLLGIAIGLTVGFVGGILRLLYLNRIASAATSNVTLPWSLAAIPIALAVIAGFVRLVGGPAPVYLSFLGLSAATLFLLAFSRRQ